MVSCALLLGSIWPAQAQEPSATRSYRIGPRDQVQVRVDEIPDLDVEQAVGDDGTINLDVVGTIDARGLTESELALRIRSRLVEEGVRRATVHVSVSAYRSRPVSIMGAIRTPGNHFVPGSANLMETLLNAGGLAAEHGSTIFVRRRADNGLSDQVEIPIAQLIEAGNPDVNIPIFAGDLINIALARSITVHFLGQVAQAGSSTIRGERVTLLTAIASAGGLTETAGKKILIKRQAEDGKLNEIVADYRRILNGSSPDIELQDGDLIIVKESFF